MPSSQNYNTLPATNDSTLLNKLNDLEHMMNSIDHKEHPSMTPEPVRPSPLDPYMLLKPPVPPTFTGVYPIQPIQLNSSVDSAFPYTQMNDPAMQQLASMLQHQDDENKKLRDILENFGKDMNREEHFEEQYNNANSKIQQMNG